MDIVEGILIINILELIVMTAILLIVSVRKDREKWATGIFSKKYWKQSKNWRRTENKK